MLRPFFAALLPLLLSGCASWNFFTKDLGEPKTGMSVDIKQRMVFVNRNDDPTKTKWGRVCAEPSPDALSSFGASVGASVFNPTGTTVQGSLSTSEAASFIGLRTQSIQLMRDAMYRACEAYMSGAMEEEDYLFIQRRFQAQVVGLLAIEQLTGTIAAQPITVHTSSAGSAGSGANEEADRLAAARKQLAEQQNKLATSRQGAEDAKAAHDPLKAAAEKLAAKKPEDLSADDKKTLTDAKAAKDTLDKANEQRKLDDALVKIYADAATVADEDFKQAKGRVRTSAISTANIPLQIQQRQPSDAAIAEIAEAVQFIITKMFKVAFSDNDDVCYRRMFASTKDRELLKAMAAVCQSIKLEEEQELLAKVNEEEKADDASTGASSSTGTKPPGGASSTAKPQDPKLSPTKGKLKTTTSTVKALDRLINLPAAAPAPTSTSK